MVAETSTLSAFERKRLENIKANQARLRDLTTTADKLYSKPAPKPTPRNSQTRSSQKRSVTVKREPTIPTRSSSRLAGIKAEPGAEAEKRKFEDVIQEKPKRQRISGDLDLNSIVVPGKKWNQGENYLAGVIRGAKPYERSFPSDGDIGDEAASKGLKELRETMSNLSLYENYEPNQIKITPERVYTMAFHPTSDKPLVFAGDKAGNLGLFDASQERPDIKAEDDDEADEPTPQITAFTLHPNTISSIVFSSDPNSLFTSSYDSTIRRLDLQKGVATEVYAATPEDDVSISCLDIPESDPNLLYFSTLSGYLGKHDIRSPKNTQWYLLSEKKVGGFSLHPTLPHLVASASLDRTMKLWDLRKLTKSDEYSEPHLVGEYSSRLSVSHAAWSSTGQIATTSYDDTVRIFSVPSPADLAPGSTINDGELTATTVIPHNNQTGRWVTILKPYWQQAPSDGAQKLVIGNMNRFVDIYSSTGDQIAQLGGDGIGQVPAVTRFHPTQNWVAGGTATGKLCLWM